MSERKKGRNLFVLGLTCLVVSGCGGGNDSGDSENPSATGTQTVIADRLEVLDESTSTSTGLVSGLTKTEFASDSDFAQTETRQYVQTPARKATRQINYYMCLMEQMRPEAMADKGAYLAIVNEKPCEGHPVPEKDLLPFIVEVTENNSDYTIKFWNKRGDSRYLGQAEVTELPSDTDPNGRFSLKWQKQDFDGTGWTDGEQGIIKPYTTSNGQKGFKWFEDDYEDYAGHLIFPGDNLPGQLRLKISYQNQDDISHGLEYNDNYVHVLSQTVSDGTTSTQLDQCYDRGAKTYLNWGYNLFTKTDGTEVTVNNGFPFKFNGKFGSVGYWGVTFEGNTEINGRTITRLKDGSGKAGRTYTLDESASSNLSQTDSTVSFQLLDSNNNVVDFQPPKGLTYTVEKEDRINPDPNSLDGTQIDLAYSGSEQLTFPTINNYDWLNGTVKLNLKAGTIVHDLKKDKDYLLKPTDQAIKLQAASSGCTELDGQTAITNLSLPTTDLLEDVGITWSDKPTTPDDASVMAGELQ